jgi:diguanylate cyclase (GGDEF)-like protein
MIRLLICDDAEAARRALRAMLHEQGEIEIVGEAANGLEAVELAAALAPDVVLMDVAMPVLDGVGATRQIRDLLPGARIVAFAGSSEREVVDAMLEAGADAYCVKGAPLWELERAIAGASDPLLRLAHSLTRSPSGGIGALVARELHELTGGAAAAVYLVTEEGLSLAGAAGAFSAEAVGTPPVAAVRAFEDSVPVAADADAAAALEQAGVSFGDAFAVPLVSDGLAFGSVLVAMPVGLPFIIDVELVAAVADLAAAAVASERLLLLTRTEARNDVLTGLPNRRAFDERLDELIAGRRPFGLALVDLDDFKRINDRFGHQAGDAALREFARVAQRAMRANDELYRFGGDEFALLIEGLNGIQHAVERLSDALRLHRRPRRLPTASIGVATAPGDGSSRSALLARADEALYAAKRAGKAQVAVLGREVPIAPRVLVVDDDLGLRGLLRTTLEAIELDVREAATAAQARAAIAAEHPDLIILDVGLPDTDGLEFCRELKSDARTTDIAVAILTGADIGTSDAARAASADGFLRKPFSPLELLAVAQRLLGRPEHEPMRRDDSESAEQLQLYAQDLRRLLEIERGQRALVQHAYRQTVTALTAALDSKDIGTGAHSQRVLRYAAELARAVEPVLLEEASVEYGFLLHDIGKIGIPDHILRKRGPLTNSERSVLETHTVLGEQMLGGVPLLAGAGIRIVRSHHERWDGDGYPDRLSRQAIPLGARVFAVADTLDAMTSNRPYRAALAWDDAVAEIAAQRGRQFDPEIVDAFRDQEPGLRRIYYELSSGLTLA